MGAIIVEDELLRSTEPSPGVENAAPEPRPEAADLANERPGLGNWRAVGAAAIGAAHTQAGLPCQDALGYRLIPLDGGPPVLIAALADGAGSAERAEQGAQLAVACALDFLQAFFENGLPPAAEEADWRGLLLEAFAAAREAVLARAEEDGEPVRSYAATLACLVAAGDMLATATLGDGVIVAQAAGGELFTVSRPQRGEYANETTFLTQEDALDMAQVVVLRQEIAALAMFSDGLMRLALTFPAHEPFRPFFTPLLAFAGAATDTDDSAVAQLTAFLASERVNARTDDDKSLLLAVRTADNRGTPEI